MKAQLKESRMLDGSKVYDVNIYANSNPDYGNMCIFTCESEDAAIHFFAELTKLVEKYTVETIEEV